MKRTELKRGTSQLKRAPMKKRSKRHRDMPAATESEKVRLGFLESAWLAIDAALASLCEIRFDIHR